MLYNDDCLKIMKDLQNDSIDMIFADPPYFLSNGGLTIKNGKIAPVYKGEWDVASNYDNIDTFTFKWLEESFRILKNGGTIWISSTSHNIFSIQKSLKDLGFKIINIIIWHKSDPPPLIYKNKFQFSYEFIIWASKGKNKCFNYNEMYKIANKEMHDVWEIPAVTKEEKTFGYHPTQKPERLLERIILCSTNVNDMILDPFMGSGTTGIVATRLKRRFTGIEREKKYFVIAKNRIYG